MQESESSTGQDDSEITDSLSGGRTDLHQRWGLSGFRAFDFESCMQQRLAQIHARSALRAAAGREAEFPIATHARFNRAANG